MRVSRKILVRVWRGGGRHQSDACLIGKSYSILYFSEGKITDTHKLLYYNDDASSELGDMQMHRSKNNLMFNTAE